MNRIWYVDARRCVRRGKPKSTQSSGEAGQRQSIAAEVRGVVVNRSAAPALVTELCTHEMNECPNTKHGGKREEDSIVESKPGNNSDELILLPCADGERKANALADAYPSEFPIALFQQPGRKCRTYVLRRRMSLQDLLLESLT